MLSKRLVGVLRKEEQGREEGYNSCANPETLRSEVSGAEACRAQNYRKKKARFYRHRFGGIKSLVQRT